MLIESFHPFTQFQGTLNRIDKIMGYLLFSESNKSSPGPDVYTNAVVLVKYQPGTVP